MPVRTNFNSFVHSLTCRRELIGSPSRRGLRNQSVSRTPRDPACSMNSPLHRNPQSVVTVFVTAQPVPKERSNSNRASTGNSPPNGGPKLTKFTIHKDYICFYSPFFASAFNGPYKEGQTRTMTLYEIEPEAFGMFVSWLYQRKLPTHTGEFEHVDLVHLANLWILGDRFLIPSLQKNAMYRMHTIIHEGRSESFGGFIDVAYKY